MNAEQIVHLTMTRAEALAIKAQLNRIEAADELEGTALDTLDDALSGAGIHETEATRS